ncbi:uncharacterized protein LOC113798842 [Dermatophagoides pteronyssinus]|uniref:Uncharacterized protein LOC113798842 n=1 Tax=Dermatophagoides pteronyssinus TaxID=6956 RepID=A0A6P6YK03_DERPT|nr:uncharacterized protein LOC113798842 [Dermatophagoides pteronyssinus]
MPIQTLQYKIRHLKRQEIEQLLQLCKAEGRHMGTVAEIESWMQIDPNGFFVAVNEKDHRIIGSCCGMCLSKTHGYVGMYVVSKEYRGLGIGKQIWSAAIQHLGTRNQGLSAVSHLFTLYRDKAGFSHVADWTVDLYRLDYMERMILIHCNKHQQIKRRKYDKRQKAGSNNNNHPMTTTTTTITVHDDNDDGVDDDKRRRQHEHIDLISSLTTKECVFCCLGHQYKSKQRKYLRQKRMLINMMNNNKSNLEFSDDESYGFSSLFFGADDEIDNANVGSGNVDNIDQSIKENIIDSSSTTTTVTATTPAKMKKATNSSFTDSIQLESLEFLFKFRFCKCIRCHGGKMRTIILNGQDDQLIEKVVEYDHRLHQYDRSRIVRLTLIEKNCISRIAMLGQTVVGYGCVKPSLQNMWIMCPLYADNEFVARMLMIDLISDLILISQSSINHNTIIPTVVLKTPSNNHNACRLLKELGFVKQDYSLKRCYTKQLVQVPTQFIYALHTSVFCTE